VERLSGVVRKVPEIILTVSFCTVCNFLTKVICLPVNHSWHLYVSTGRHMALKASFQLAWSSPLTEFPSSWRALSVAHALLHTVSMWWVQLRHMSKKKPRYRIVFLVGTRS
jgi:hypothetical protein